MLLSISKSMFKEYNFEKHHTIFKLKENEENILLTDILEMHFLEMKKVKTLQQNDKLGQWLTFIKVDEMALHDEKARIDEVIKEVKKIRKEFETGK